MSVLRLGILAAILVGIEETLLQISHKLVISIKLWLVESPRYPHEAFKLVVLNVTSVFFFPELLEHGFVIFSLSVRD